MLWPVTDFIEEEAIDSCPPSYWYTSRCPQTQAEPHLPRTAQVEAIAHGLMKQLAANPPSQAGKMYGVLLVEMPTGEQWVLKAFSGLLAGQALVPGWVPPIPGREQVRLAEARTLEQLAQLKQAIIALQTISEREQYAQLKAQYDDRRQVLAAEHRHNKTARDRQREILQTTLTPEARSPTLNQLIRESQQEGMARRRLKREQDARLKPLKAAIASADEQIHRLKQERKMLSRQLQAQMHQVYALTNFAGHSATLTDLMPDGLPTGTGDCAAPKLLHYAATHHLKPLAMAEFWWGTAQGEKRSGEFYGACAERCQPIMGFLLSGLPTAPLSSHSQELQLAILYQDADVLVVNKPSGLLSVPGRGSHRQDSVLSRLRCQFPDLTGLQTVHRLDQDTSGLLVLAITPAAHAHLSQQFAERRVQKTYEAILSRPIQSDSGSIELPLWADPRDRPRQSVNATHGKPSLTEFQRIVAGETPRVRFMLHTGRTHQLRVHAAHPNGLNAPILGDRLYGESGMSDRLHLHATGVQFIHPTQNLPLRFKSMAPF